MTTTAYSFVPDFIDAETAYTVKVRAELQGKEGEMEWRSWVHNINVFQNVVHVERGVLMKERKRKYSVNEMNPRIDTKASDYGYCTAIENTPLPPKQSDFVEH